MAKQPAKGRKTPAKQSTAKPSDTKITDAEVTSQQTAAEVKASAAEVKPAPVAAAEKPVEKKPEAGKPRVAPEMPKVEKPAPAPVLETENRGSAMPAVFGGLVAGVLGFGAAYLVLPKADASLASQVSAQSNEIASLRDQVSAIPAVDLSGLEAAQASATEMVAGLGNRITDLETRLDDLSNRAGLEGSVATAAYEEELANLKADIDEMRGSAMAELDSARAQAASIQENADAAARNAAARAALSRVQGALETGAPFGEALGELAAAMQSDVDEALSMVSDGAPTLASLQASFPQAARAALATARAEGASGEPEGGITAFFRDQLDVRSVAPKEGDSADAVLSRAEASLREGRLTDTLAELSALPEVARAELTEWQALAEARADALAAAATLSTTLNDN